MRQFFSLLYFAGVSGALQHDSIVGGDNNGVQRLRISSEAQKTADKALEALRKQRLTEWSWWIDNLPFFEYFLYLFFVYKHVFLCNFVWFCARPLLGLVFPCIRFMIWFFIKSNKINKKKRNLFQCVTCFVDLVCLPRVYPILIKSNCRCEKSSIR